MLHLLHIQNDSSQLTAYFSSAQHWIVCRSFWSSSTNLYVPHYMLQSMWVPGCFLTPIFHSLLLLKILCPDLLASIQ
jgi:hypothetical protein